MTTAVDQAAREAALDPRGSFCVSAPAGSGKTELLTQRILNLLGQCERPENILAITFTRKAAGEMRQRLLQTLKRARGIRDLSELPRHEQHTLALAQEALRRDADKGWQLLDNPARLQITTIDSFNNRLASHLPLLSGFGATPDISQQPTPLYEEAILELFGRLENDPGLADDLARVIAHLGNDLERLQALLLNLLANRDQWLSHIVALRDPRHDDRVRGRMERALQAVIHDTLATATTVLSPWMPGLLDALRHARGNLQREDPEHPLAGEDAAMLDEIDTLGDDIRQLPLWRILTTLLLTAGGDLRKSVDRRNGFPVDGDSPGEKARRKSVKNAFVDLLDSLRDSADVVQVLRHIRLLPEPVVAEPEWPILRSLMRVLTHLAGELTVVFRRHHQCDYIEVSIRALEALGDDEDPTPLALRLDYAIQHILVDEFQDTSQMQIDLLARLMRGWSEDDGHTLFIVGDGMQSCYAFRNANVGLFLAARQHGIGPSRMAGLDLEVNFRSDQAVVDWVNHLFRHAFPARDNPGRGAVRYSPSTAFHPRNDDHGVALQLFTQPSDSERLQGELAEAARVADIIETLQSQTPDADIAILVKSRSHLRQILPALKSRGIRWNATEIDSLGAYPDIRDLMTLTRALLNPADRTAWLGLLRCPFIGLSMADCAALARHGLSTQRLLSECLRDSPSTLPVSQAGQAVLARLGPILEAAPVWRLTRSLRDWTEHCWILLGGPASLGPETDNTHVEAFFSLLEEQEDQGDIPSVARLQERLDRFHVNNRPSLDVHLQIMTIHKAKGLQFDYVIVPRLNAGSPGEQPALLQWHQHVDSEGHHHLLLSVMARRGQPQHALHDYISAEKKERRRLEDTRVLYIAVTRAVRKAWLIGSLRENARGELKAVNGSLLGTVWEALEHAGTDVEWSRVDTAVADPAAERGREERPLIETRSLPDDWTAPALSLPDTVDETVTFHYNRCERLRGDLVHDLLMQVAQGRLTLDDSARLSALHREWTRRFAPHSDTPGQEADNILGQLERLSHSATARWLLDPDHEASACELSLSDFRGRWRRESIVDRTFIHAGERWIIDYKTTPGDAAQPVSGFIAEETQRYREQLLRYAELMRVMSPEIPLRLAIYFTALDHLEEVSIVTDDAADP